MIKIFLLCIIIAFQGLYSDQEPYRLRFGDVMDISVYGEDDTARETQVGPDGKVNYLFMHGIPASGKTIAEFRNELTERLKTYYKYPLLSIVPKRYGWQYYTVIGQVVSPGIYRVNSDSTILSALCASQGFSTRLYRNQTIDMVDFDRSFMARNGEYVPVDFESLVRHGDMRWNYPLQSGDYLFFANSGLNRVFVLGEVRRPSSVDYLQDITLTQAIADAGGITDIASSRIVVIRGSLCYPRWFYIDANLIFKGCAYDFPLMPNDIVYVAPLQFLTLRDIVRGGISAFVSIVSNVGGTNAFLEVTPAAKNVNIISPVPVVGGGIVSPPLPAPVVP